MDEKEYIADVPISRILRLTISSGEGKARLRQAVLVAGAYKSIGDAYPTLDGVERGIKALQRWVLEHASERTDWLLLPFETLMHWPHDEDE